MSIDYRPNISYKKNYNSEGNFERSELEKQEVDSSFPSVDLDRSDRDKIEKILELIEDLETVLPKDVVDIIKPSNEVIKEVIDGNNKNDKEEEEDSEGSDKDNEIDKEEDNSEVIYPDREPGDSSSDIDKDTGSKDDGDSDWMFSDPPSQRVELIQNEVPNYILTQRQYESDLLSIFKHYFLELENSIARFATEFFMIIKESKIENIETLAKKYKGKTLDLKDKNLYHLSDSIIRSQITRKHQTRFVSKIFNDKETVTQIRALKVSAELKARYEKQEYIEQKNLSDVTRNELLGEARALYERNYKDNLLNLYKYLNSAAVLIDESLMAYLKETQSKSLLIKNEEGFVL